MIAQAIFWALMHRRSMLVVCLLVSLAGAWSCWQGPLEAYPDISPPQVLVISALPGRAPEEIERQITIPIESAMEDVPDVVSLRSRTIFGLSLVELVFQDGTDKYFARQQVQEALSTVSLPLGVTPKLGPLAAASGEIFRYELTSGHGQSLAELRSVQDWVVAPRLEHVAGVAEVVTFGGRQQQFTLKLDPNQLARFALTLNDVIDAVQANNANAGGSVVRRGEMSLVIRGRGLLQSEADLENTVINSLGGTPVYVRDVARVDVDSAEPQGIFGKDEDADSVEGIVLMTRGENPSQILARIRAEVEDLNAHGLPHGIRVEPFYDRGSFVRSTLSTVGLSVSAGITLVLLALVGFFGSPSLALLVVATIPFSLLFAFLLLHLTGVPLELLSIGAIDVGILVDGTVIMLDHFARRLPRSPAVAAQGDRRRMILALTVEVKQPLLVTLLIVLCGYVPLLTLTGIEGSLFRSMALTAIFALFGAAIFVLLVVPSLANLILRRGIRDWESPLLARTHVFYAQILRFLLRARWLVVVGVLALVSCVAGWVLPRLGVDFLPEIDEGVIWVRANFPTGTALGQTAAFGDRMRTVVHAFPEVSFVTSQAGRNSSGTDAFVASRLEMMIGLKPRLQWRFGTKRALLDELSAQLRDHFPTTRFNFTQPIIDSVTEDTSGTSADLAVVITGKDLEILEQLGEQAAAVLRSVPGALDVNVEEEGPQPQLIIEPDRARCARYDVKIEAVNRLINTAIGAEPIGTLYDGERRFKIVVRFDTRFLSSIDLIGQLPVFSDAGVPIPLAQLVTFNIADGQTLIARDGGRRCITVRCDIVGRDQRGFAEDATRRVAAQVALPNDYRLRWIGMFENFARANRHLFFLVPLATVVVFGLLVLTFGRQREAMLVMLSVPFSLVGGALGLYVRGMTLNVSSCAGFATLFGVSMLNGILMVGGINSRRRVGPTLEDAILDGARSRLRPILMTSALGMLGLLPASVAVGIGSDIQRPLATVVVWGLLSAALLTLFVVPVLARILLPEPPATPASEN